MDACLNANANEGWRVISMTTHEKIVEYNCTGSLKIIRVYTVVFGREDV